MLLVHQRYLFDGLDKLTFGCIVDFNVKSRFTFRSNGSWFVTEFLCGAFFDHPWTEIIFLFGVNLTTKVGRKLFFYLFAGVSSSSHSIWIVLLRHTSSFV